MDLRQQIIDTANQMGMDPVHLATIISYETGGTFNPNKAGPTTKWGQHRGLLQWGEPQAKQYGIDWSNPQSQFEAMPKYFAQAGWKPGMGLLDAYSAVNAGSVGRYNASDTAAGGAPGTVRDKVQNQMGPHMAKAQGLLGGTWGPSGPSMPAPVKPASISVPTNPGMPGMMTPGMVQRPVIQPPAAIAPRPITPMVAGGGGGSTPMGGGGKGGAMGGIGAALQQMGGAMGGGGGGQQQQQTPSLNMQRPPGIQLNEATMTGYMTEAERRRRMQGAA
jgi:hypothetical protein